MNKNVIPPGAAITGNFSLDVQLANSGKKLTISGYMYDGESVQSLNDRLDIVHDVADRQRVRAEIPELEAARDQKAKQLYQMKEVMTELEGRVAGGAKLSSQEKKTLRNLGLNLTLIEADLEKGSAAVADAKLKAGMV